MVNFEYEEKCNLSIAGNASYQVPIRQLFLGNFGQIDWWFKKIIYGLIYFIIDRIQTFIAPGNSELSNKGLPFLNFLKKWENV